MSMTERVRRPSTPRLMVAALLLGGTMAITPALAAGGSFTGHYHGFSVTYAGKCRGKTANFIKFNSMGSGTFIGAGNASGFISLDPNCAESATLTSTSTPANSIMLSLMRTPTGGSYTVTGGSGAFAKASGSGTFTYSGSGSAFKINFTGTLTY